MRFAALALLVATVAGAGGRVTDRACDVSSRRSSRGGVACAAAATWTPADLANVSSWHRADLGVTLNGSRVSAWADQSGNGHTLSQGTAGQQPLVTAGAVGGKTALTFAPGRQDNLAFAGGFTQGAGASRVYAVLHSRTQSGYSLVVNSSGSGMSVYKGFLGLDNQPTTYQNSVALTHASAITGAHVISWRVGTTVTLGVAIDNGAETTATNGVFLAGAWTTVGTTVVGFEPDMDLAELIICDSAADPAVSAAEQTQLLAYFSARYGIW